VRLSGPSLEPAVAPGGQVTVRFVSNGLSVELPGRAKSAGAIGQIIDVAVTIPETRETTTHQGTVIAAGIVEVRA
jgi:flagella basal body P-ring formation protein FlgA